MALRIVLVRPKDPANVGAAARAMKNFDVHELVLVAPQRSIGARAYSLASHAGDVLDTARTLSSVEEAVAGCSLVLGTTARPRAAENRRVYTPRELSAEFSNERLAVLFGPEDFGLSNRDLDRCQGTVIIPTGDYASLNLAQAVQLICYEWFVGGPAERAVVAPSSPAPERADRAEYEAMYAQLLATLHLIGYTDETREESAERMFRGIFDRAELTERELAALRGLWRQVVWAARAEPERFKED